MKTIYLISENTLKIAKKYPKEQIVLFKETYRISFESEYKTITSAQIAKDIIKASNKSFGTNSKEKAKEISCKLDEKYDFYLVYSEEIKEPNLEKKTILVIENNKQLNKIDAQKIYLLPPWPIVIEKIKKEYPDHIIKTITPEDENLFRVELYFKNLNKLEEN